MSKLDKKISIGFTGKDKKALQEKAQELGCSLSGLIRNIVLEKYQSLQVGYYSGSSITMKHDIDIRKPKPPSAIKPMSKEQLSMKECVNELKEVFSKGLNVLGKMDDSILGIKDEKELEAKARKSEEKIYERLEKEINNKEEIPNEL